MTKKNLKRKKRFKIKGNMKKISPAGIGIIIMTGVIFGAIVLTALENKPTQFTQYNLDDPSRPQIEIPLINFDFGKIKLSDKVTKEIQIKNSGSNDLELQNFYTSCGCTFVQVIYDGQTSPQFSMHNNPLWQTKISSQKTATLRIIYEPRLMPVDGRVTRAVFFKTNDPGQPEVTITFSAEVE